MAGAEGEPGFDPDRDHAGGNCPCVMRAIDEKSPRPHWWQAVLALLDPILIGQRGDKDIIPGYPAQQIRIRFAVVKRFHDSLWTERVLDDEHGLRRWWSQLE